MSQRVRDLEKSLKQAEETHLEYIAHLGSKHQAAIDEAQQDIERAREEASAAKAELQSTQEMATTAIANTMKQVEDKMRALEDPRPFPTPRHLIPHPDSRRTRLLPSTSGTSSPPHKVKSRPP